MRKALKRKWRKARVRNRFGKNTNPYCAKRKRPQSSFVLKQLLEYHVFFGDNAKDESIEDIVKQIPREMLFNFVGVLNNIYGNATLDKLNLFFSSESINNRRIVFSRVVDLRKNNPQRDFLFSSNMTCMEVMRYAFAYSPVDVSFSMNLEQGEMLFFKLILLINEKVVAYKEIENNSVAKMCFILSFINPVMQAESVQDVRNRAAFQMELAIHFFEMISKGEELSQLYQLFLDSHHIICWEDYIITIYGILAAGQFKSGRIERDLNIDVDRLLTKDVLESISLPYNMVINYSAIDKDDRCSNSDYRMLRDKPIIKFRNGDFFIYNMEFMLDRLFNSLYFEFKFLNQSAKLEIDIAKLFTDTFSERIIFDMLMSKSINENRYVGISEAECVENYKKKDDELGAPDYTVMEENNVLIFECKDIRISGEVIETHDYEAIINEYKNKLFYKRDKKNKVHRIGITQLTGHIESIRKGKFNWYSFDRDTNIYPVLVLSDYKNVKMGFNVISNEWYQSSLNELGIVGDNNKPLIVLSFITLFKYNHLFKKNGFKYYFDMYINSFSRNQQDIIGKYQTFDFFMSQYPYHLYDLEIMVQNILNNKVKRNELSIIK
jgi:hypothetical protein